MKNYEITINMFLTHYLNVNLKSHSNKKWTHVRICEIIRNRGLEDIIIKDKNDRNEAFRNNDGIYKGDILLVRDQKGELEPYYNPYHLKDISDCYMGLNDSDVLSFKINLLREEIEKLYIKTTFTLETISEDFEEYSKAIEILNKKREELEKLLDLYSIYESEKSKDKIKKRERRRKYD